MVYPVQKVGDVAINPYLVPLSAASAPNVVPNEPPYSVFQGHQRAAAVSLSSAQNGINCTLWRIHPARFIFTGMSVPRFGKFKLNVIQLHFIHTFS